MNSFQENKKISFGDYELIDSGKGEKFERFGDYFLIRPEPEAIHNPGLDKSEWQRTAHAQYISEGRIKGHWEKIREMPDQWTVSLTVYNTRLQIKLSLSQFKHVGIFPEQASNWQYIFENIKNSEAEAPQFLNLFAYTGVASLVACAAGAKVTHVDALKQLNQRAGENAVLSGFEPFRRISEDIQVFVKRELKRDRQYHGIILDPPAFGRGPGGESWKLERDILPLLVNLRQLLFPSGYFLVLNMYSASTSLQFVNDLIKEVFPGGRADLKEVTLSDNFGKKITTGFVARIKG